MLQEIYPFFLIIFIINLLIFYPLREINLILKKKYRNKILIKKNEPLSLGGILLIINFLFISVLSYNKDLLYIFNFNEKLTFIILCILIFLIGLLDDLLSLNPWTRLITTGILLYFVIIDLDLGLDKIYIDFLLTNLKLNTFSNIFTVICILTFINFNNMYDGINGQSSIYYLIIIIFLITKNILPIYLSLFLIFFLFFFFYNIRNKVYLGDSGIYLVSTILSVFFLYGFNNKIIFLSEMICLLFIPFVDMIRLFVSRLMKLSNPFSGDKNHYHHILSERLNKIFVLLLMHLPPVLGLILLNISNAYFVPIVLVNLSLYTFFYILFSNK